MPDKSFNRLRRFNYRTFKNLSLKGKDGIIRFYDSVLGLGKKYNPMRFYGRKQDKKQ